MEKIKDVKIESYDAGDGFVVDVTETADTYEAHIYKKENGDKKYMCGVKKDAQTKRDFIEIAASQVDTFRHIFEEEVLLDQEACSHLFMTPDGEEEYCPFY